MEDLRKLFQDGSSRVALGAGDFIFREGDEAREAFVVLDGLVEILVGNLRVEMAGPGSVLGEMALIENLPRTATARAVSPCTLARVDSDGFHNLVRKEPGFATLVMKVMAERLRRMNRMVVDGVQE